MKEAPPEVDLWPAPRRWHWHRYSRWYLYRVTAAGEAEQARMCATCRKIKKRLV